MLSVVVEKPNSMAVCERPMPEPQAGEVRMRVRYAGICGSDLHIFDWIARGLVDPGHIITHKVDFHDVASAFDIAERDPRESCKVLLDFGVDA